MSGIGHLSGWTPWSAGSPTCSTRPPAATDDEVAAVARAWGAALPGSYVEVARRHQGESPEPGALRVGGTPRTVECRLHFGDRPTAWSLPVVDAELRDRLPTGVHPVAATTSGTFWCLDLRGGGAAVVHVDPDVDPDQEPEHALWTVAADVTAFLEQPHPGDGA